MVPPPSFPGDASLLMKVFPLVPLSTAGAGSTKKAPSSCGSDARLTATTEFCAFAFECSVRNWREWVCRATTASDWPRGVGWGGGEEIEPKGSTRVCCGPPDADEDERKGAAREAPPPRPLLDCRPLAPPRGPRAAPAGRAPSEEDDEETGGVGEDEDGAAIGAERLRL